MGTTSAVSPERTFAGWSVVIALAVMIFMTSGIRFSVGPFLKPMVADLGLDRARFSLVVSVNLLLYGLFSPFAARLAARVGTSTVIGGGALVLAASLAATAQASTVWQFYLAYGVAVAIGLAATGNVVASALAPGGSRCAARPRCRFWLLGRWLG